MPKIPVTLAQVADHVDHVRRVAASTTWGWAATTTGNDAWPASLEDVSGYPRSSPSSRAAAGATRTSASWRAERPARHEAGRGGRAPALEGAARLDGHHRGARRRRKP